ncbi:g2/mitotic-specific cyclin s13-7 [Quercus suber]|uniref:B-like cyclin n=1 Tax=Quercus suber TaxID=58331 RepID=A0AAW0JQA9_QUESU
MAILAKLLRCFKNKVAIVALVIACKFEENWSPSALTLMEEDEDGYGSTYYSQQQIDAIEKNILQKLGWKLLVPTIHSFLVEIFDSCGYLPSTLAVSAIYAAMCVLKKSHGSKQIFLNTNQSHSKGEVTFCAGMLQRLASMAPTGKLMRTLAEKYSDQILILHSKK